jgi:hypothetical protein
VPSLHIVGITSPVRMTMFFSRERHGKQTSGRRDDADRVELDGVLELDVEDQLLCADRHNTCQLAEADLNGEVFSDINGTVGIRLEKQRLVADKEVREGEARVLVEAVALGAADRAAQVHKSGAVLGLRGRRGSRSSRCRHGVRFRGESWSWKRRCRNEQK